MAERAAPAVGVAGSEPEPPRIFLDTTYVPPAGGQTIAVQAGGDLQAAFNQARPGDVITLEAGATFTGNFTLPAKAGAGWIFIRTSAPDSSLPRPGQRITPGHASVLPKIVTSNADPALNVADGAHHYRLVGLEFTVAPSLSLITNLIMVGDGTTSLAQLPHNIIFDRVYIHGNPTVNLRRGMSVNGASSAVIDSHISDCHEEGRDSQAILVFNSPGPLRFTNNYLEGSTENIMFGGADPNINNLVPSDIEFRRNHCFKPLSWKADDPSYAGRDWSIKNLLELKNAQRILIEGNIFENNWADSQVGFAILFTVRNEGGTAPWSVVQDVTFINNLVRHSAGGVNMHGTDDVNPSLPTSRIRISNNLFDDISGPRWGNGSGRLFQIGTVLNDLTIEHNTGFQSNHLAVVDGSPSSQGFTFQNNITANNEFGFFGSGQGTGTNALNFYFPGAIFLRNVIVGGRSDLYPSDNSFPDSFANVGFVDLAGGNYRLASTSPYKNAGTDGKDIGVNFDVLNLALTGTTSVTTVSAASYAGDTIAMESIVSAFGTGLATSTQGALTTPLPTELGGTAVTVRDVFNVVWPCPLFFISPTQVNFQIPILSGLGNSEVTVSSGGNIVAKGMITVARVSPGIFTADASGRGLPTGFILRNRSNGSPVVEPIAIFDSSQNKYVAVPIDLGPISDQVFLVLFGTGFRYHGGLASVALNVGGIGNEVTFAGQQGGFVGLDQVNARLQRVLAGRGEVDVILTVEGVRSNVVNLVIR
ncbi:MAG: hypothetical protein L0226_11200 [Acidobacteria bacterium]|nr:hypothetical protein [Acidobacteriota bacterium]